MEREQTGRAKQGTILSRFSHHVARRSTLEARQYESRAA